MKAKTFAWFFMALGLWFFIACTNNSSNNSESLTVQDDGSKERVAVLFVGHGEPALFEDGDESITLADGTPFGPHAASLGVPKTAQYTEWAAAYEEIATAMTYLDEFPFDEDFNGNGTPHEVAIAPQGDVPPFFTWEAFRAELFNHYQLVSDYSPHNDTLKDLVADIDIQVDGADIDTFLAFLDAVPRIPDVIWEITQSNQYDKLVVVPLLLASSTHTHEVESFVHETAHMTGGLDVVVCEPFFEIPYMQKRLKNAVVAMARHVRKSIPTDVADEDIGVVLASHGTPYVPPLPQFGWQEGEIFSYLILTEDRFHFEIKQALPWEARTGRMNYSSPTIEDALDALQEDGYSHVMVIPSAFPTAAIHTMWDVANASLGEAALPQQGVMTHARGPVTRSNSSAQASEMTVYYSALGFADLEPGRSEYLAGLSFVARIGVLEALEQGLDTGGTDDGGDPPVIDNTCLPGEICVTVNANETTGSDLRLMLYETTEDAWPQQFRSLPTPSWVVSEYPPVPDKFPIRIRIPLTENLFAISSKPLEGARLGLAIATGVASIMVVEPTDARGFSASTIIYHEGTAMDYGTINLEVPAGDVCDLNAYHPSCLTGPFFWKEHFLGEEAFVPGAVYMDTADIDGDGVKDIVMVGEPHFEEPQLPLTVLKLGVYYMNPDLTVRETEILDQWSETDPAFYSPWSVKVIQHSGKPMIIVGTNIPGLAPLEEGAGNVHSYTNQNGTWVRSVVIANQNPTQINYNAMIVVPCDIDQDGDEDLALSSAFGTSAVGSWMENRGQENQPWIPHLQTIAAGTDPSIRGTLTYKSADLNGDSYPEVIYNAMFDIPDTDPPRYRGEIWVGVNPGPGDKDAPWQKVVVDDDNWASADMWFHDFDGDGDLDLIANQIFSSTVTRYHHPGNLDDPWIPEVIISGLTSPSDMWLADIDQDGLTDVISADHTAHRGVWHKNPGPTSSELWKSHLIFRNIRMPGDFTMTDLDEDGDLDWVGTSMTRGQAFIVEEVQPASSLVATIALPDTFVGNISSLMVTLATEMPVTGMPAAILANISNTDKDGDGELDVDQILNPSDDLVLAIEDVGVSGDYYVVVTLYMEGGGQYQPVAGVDYMAISNRLPLGEGKVEVRLELAQLPAVP